VVANAEMTRYWNEEGGRNWLANERRFDVMLEPFEAALERVAAAAPGERVLDVGCGFGTTTLALARAVAPHGTVTALDLSEPMVARALERAGAAGVDNVVGLLADAQTGVLPSERFDLAVSRFGVMFFDDPVAAFTNLRGAMRPGGRLAFVCWQPAPVNSWIAVPVAAVVPIIGVPELPPPGAPGPFAFGDTERVRTILSSAGLEDIGVEPFAGPVVMGAGEGLDAAIAHVAASTEMQRLLGQRTEEERAAALAAVRAAFADHLDSGRVVLAGAAWVVTARAS
jgi:SAM-dependent methyltransferase